MTRKNNMKKNKYILIIMSAMISVLATLYVSNVTINCIQPGLEHKRCFFITFPSDESYIFKTKSLSKNEIIGKVDRAITVSYPEIKANIAKIVLNEKEDGYVSIPTLSYLPPVEYAKYIINWRRSLKYQGYTDGQFEIKPIVGNRYSVTLTLKDSKHVRLHKYRYETDGNTVYDIKPISIFSGFHLILYSIIFIPVFLLSFIILNNIIKSLISLGRPPR
jgi:hypothetical protein